MKGVFILLLAVLTSYTGMAQEDAKAKAILNKLSAKTKAYTTIKAEFQFAMVNKAEGTNESQTGKIQLKGDKYTLSISGQEVISDGKNIWTVLNDAEEVQINEIDEDDDESISPNKIFTMYESGFKSKFVKEENGSQIINLYPKAAEEKSYHRIALYINKAKNEMKMIKVYGKDGTTTTYTIKTFLANSSIPDAKFTFDKTKYSKFEIIDLR